jgi:hypothetical protein
MKESNLSLLSECIVVINEIIDSCDHRDRIGDNEMLNELMRDLNKQDNELVQSLVSPDSYSEEFLCRAFEIK